MLNLIRRLWYSLHRTETVYKVIRQSRYRSLLAEGKAQVGYEAGKWSIAHGWLAMRGYHLLCFAELRDARNFVVRFSWGKLAAIWKVSARGVRAYGLPQMCWVDHLTQGRVMLDASGSFPIGTIMAKAVRLEEKVWDSKEKC